MARGKLSQAQARGVRQRLAAYVERHHGGDWSVFQRVAGVERTTMAGWRSKKRSIVPDVVQLVQLAENVGLSLNWLLLGRGSMLYEPTSPAHSVPERFRAALAQYLGTSEPDVEIWVQGRLSAPAHAERPRAEHYEAVLPRADSLFSLAAELIRPLLRPALRVLIDRAWRRGAFIRAMREERGLGPDDPFDGHRTAGQVERDQDEKCEAEIEEHRLHLTVLAEYAAVLNRDGRPPFQLINYDEAGPRSPWGTLGPAQRRGKENP